MTRRISQLLRNPLIGVLGLLLSVAGIPGIVDGLPVWAEWISAIPDRIAWGLVVVGAALIASTVIANRHQIADGWARLRSAFRASADRRRTREFADRMHIARAARSRPPRASASSGGRQRGKHASSGTNGVACGATLPGSWSVTTARLWTSIPCRIPTTRMGWKRCESPPISRRTRPP